ncbi:MAG: DUF4162 domain-containing protein, partial [Bacteroidia bacterium]|nr:DUF4162 domain-containing protein [Bacteroidia bacterium]
GFDPINANIIKNEILNLKKQGSTILFSTHNMASVEELCDDIALINKSKVVLSGAVNEIRQRFKNNMYAVTYSGFINLIEASLRHQYEILSHVEKDGLHHLKFKLLDSSVSTNMLISGLLPLGNMISFNEVLPTMNDIFINAVGEMTNEKILTN